MNYLTSNQKDIAHSIPIDIVGYKSDMFGSSDNTSDTSGYKIFDKYILIHVPDNIESYDDYHRNFIIQLNDILPKNSLEKAVVEHGQLIIYIKKKDILKSAKLLRDKITLSQCVSVTAIHYPINKDRELHIVYEFKSHTSNRRLTVIVAIPDADKHITSLYAIYPSVDWHEREVYDMFGVIFDKHPSLTRILMPDDWEGHPQRKDYPLGGISVEYINANIPPPDKRRKYNG